MQTRTTLAALLLLSSQAYSFPVTTSIKFTSLTIQTEDYDGFFQSAGLAINDQVVSNECVEVAGPAVCTMDLTALAGNDQEITYSYANLNRKNIFSFTPNTADVMAMGPENTFTLGTFTYENGYFYYESIWNFELTLHSELPIFDGHVFSGRIHLFAPDNYHDDPQGSADFFYIEGVQGQALEEIGSARIYDYGYCPEGDATAPACNVGSVDLVGYINSLHLSALVNPTGGAFLHPSLTPLNAPSNVDEPPLFWMASSALAVMFGFRRKARKSA